MKTIDGGRGGGQLIRLAVAMSSLSGTPIRIENVRGARSEPGMRGQHVAAVEAVASISNARTSGVSIGSSNITFDPERIRGGETRVSVGTAGSVSLVFDAVLPVARESQKPIRVRATGGTDVRWSPPIDFYRFVKLPLLRRIGVRASLERLSRGFYPEGGGMAEILIHPGDLSRIDFTRRGSLERVRVRSIATDDLADRDVASRQIQGVRARLDDLIDVRVRETVGRVRSPATGTVVLVIAEYEHAIAGFSALGEPGVPAEIVGERAADRFLAFQDAAGAIEAHLADQLLPFLVFGGGRITTTRRTDHIESAAWLLEQFGAEIVIDTDGKSVVIESGDAMRMPTGSE
ncbi:MAG: RNA 3'-terminal phosphate cyclase [Halodesulfurarchaeum sp.]